MFTKSKKYIYISVLVFGFIISLYSLVMLDQNTYLLWDLMDSITIKLFAEHFLFFLSFCLIFHFVKKSSIKLYICRGIRS